jgi:hypothetical protein
MQKIFIAASLIANIVFVVLLATGFFHCRNARTEPDVKFDSGEHGFNLRATIDGNKPYYVVNRGGKMAFDFSLDQKNTFMVPRIFAMPDLTVYIVIPVKPLIGEIEIRVESPTEVVYFSDSFPREFFSQEHTGQIRDRAHGPHLCGETLVLPANNVIWHDMCFFG